MSHAPPNRALPWLEPGQPFPPVETAWGPGDPAPGLLAAGGVLDVPSLIAAYARGIFPWFSAGQPILWWSTDPAWCLKQARFVFTDPCAKTIQKLRLEGRLDIRFDHDFERVIRACAQTPRDGQDGTWILPAMVQAYTRLHHAGVAHSVETWIDGELAGGLYCINLGGMVFGESMFNWQSDASKMALAALVAFCRAKDLPLIDCQQNTPHLASLGGQLMPRRAFSQHVGEAMARPAPAWKFELLYWQNVISEHRRPA